MIRAESGLLCKEMKLMKHGEENLSLEESAQSKKRAPES
jgi:hypothetical protein